MFYPHCYFYLVGGLEPWNFITFQKQLGNVGNVIIPTDFHSIIFQRGRSTSNQYYYHNRPLIGYLNYHQIPSKPIIYGYEFYRFSEALERRKMPCTIAHCPTFAMILWLKMSILKPYPGNWLITRSCIERY